MKKGTVTQWKRQLEKVHQIHHENKANKDAKQARLDIHNQYKAQLRATKMLEQYEVQIALVPVRVAILCNRDNLRPHGKLTPALFRM